MSEAGLLERYQRVREEVADALKANGRPRDAVTLLAVSKYHPASDMLTLFQAGQSVFGENYVQEALAKKAFLQAQGVDAENALHMIGHVQSKKVPQVAGQFALVQTLDSRSLASIFERRLAARALRQRVLIEVNIAEEEQKSGVHARDLPGFADYILKDCPHLELAGLMCMPPFFEEGALARPYFARLRELAEMLRQETGLALPELSMGMSGDFPYAIAEGATIVRIGTAIFGPRPQRARV